VYCACVRVRDRVRACEDYFVTMFVTMSVTIYVTYTTLYLLLLYERSVQRCIRHGMLFIGVLTIVFFLCVVEPPPFLLSPQKNSCTLIGNFYLHSDYCEITLAVT